MCFPVLLHAVLSCIIRKNETDIKIVILFGCGWTYLVILDVARCYLWLFTLYINIKIGKNSC